MSGATAFDLGAIRSDTTGYAASFRALIGAGTSSFDGAYGSLSGVPSSFTPASHVHGNITNAGAIGSTANQVVVTTTSGVLTTTSTLPDANLSSNVTLDNTANVFTASQTITAGTATTSNPFLTATQTWNGSAVVFVGLDVSITNTLSSSNSSIFDWKVNGTRVVSASAAGVFLCAGFLVGSTTYSSYGGAATNWWSSSALNVGSGNIIFGTVGKYIQYKSGTGARTGNATLVAGTVTVSMTSATANTVVFLTRKTAGGTTGDLRYSVTAGTSITITSSSASDTSVVSYYAIEVA